MSLKLEIPTNFRTLNEIPLNLISNKFSLFFNFPNKFDFLKIKNKLFMLFIHLYTYLFGQTWFLGKQGKKQIYHNTVFTVTPSVTKIRNDLS